MYSQYIKKPIEESHPKKNKKNHKKSSNKSNVIYEGQNINVFPPIPIPEISKEKGFSEDDFINELSEYQEFILNSAFLDQENIESNDPNEYKNTCDELLFLLEKDQNSENLTEGVLKNMMSICEENAKWFLPIQAAFEGENNLDILDSHVLNDEDYFIAIQQRILDLNKAEKKKETTELTKNSNKYFKAFPTLGESEPKNNDNSIDIIGKLQKENSMKPIKPNAGILNFGNKYSNPKDNWNLPNNNEMFQTYKENSREEVKSLCLLFPEVLLNYIKIAYVHFGEEFEITKNFLKDYFPDCYKDGGIVENVKQVQKEKIGMKQRKIIPVNHNLGNYEGIDFEEIDPELKNESFINLRQSVKRHLKLKYIFKKSEITSNNLKNYDQAQKFKNLANEQNILLEKYKKASKIIFLTKLRRQNNYKDIDLHGFFLEEAVEILIDQIKFIKSKLEIGTIYDCNTKDMKGHKFLKYSIITGKGHNSQNKLPVLLPSIKKLLEKKNFEFKGFDHEGKIELYLPYK